MGAKLLNSIPRRIVRANVAISERIEPSIIENTHAYTKYYETGENLLRLEPNHVLDVGAGKEWPFAPELKRQGMSLTGFDIDIDEMSGNDLLDQKLCGDACESLGVPDGSVDLIMARATIEHLHDNASFVRNAHRALREDGRIIVTFPGKYAPFAILNRILPPRIAQWLLHHLVPGSDGMLGFKAFYDQASFHEFRGILVEAGFEIENEYASYFSCMYYRFFVPLFALGLAYDYLCSSLGNPRFASYLMFVAKKSRYPSTDTPSSR